MPLKQPRRDYLNERRNGFTESISFPSKLKGNEAIEAQEMMHFVINNLGEPIPTMSEMRALESIPETSSSLKEQISTLKRKQTELEVYLQKVARNCMKDDALDFYFQTDDLKYHDRDREWKEHYARLDRFERFSTVCEATGFYDTLERSRYEYVRQLSALQRRRVEVERREEGLRRAREAQFPQSTREYHAMESRQAQLRVARFLMADSNKQDQMSTQSNWAWRQTQPLINDYRTNDVFRGEVMRLVREMESKDPRQRV